MDKIQREQCQMYVTAGHVYCYCGHVLKYNDPDRKIQEQAQRYFRQRFELGKTPANKLQKGPGRARRHGSAPANVAYVEAQRGFTQRQSD